MSVRWGAKCPGYPQSPFLKMSLSSGDLTVPPCHSVMVGRPHALNILKFNPEMSPVVGQLPDQAKSSSSSLKTLAWAFVGDQTVVRSTPFQVFSSRCRPLCGNCLIETDLLPLHLEPRPRHGRRSDVRPINSLQCHLSRDLAVLWRLPNWAQSLFFTPQYLGFDLQPGQLTMRRSNRPCPGRS